MRGLITNLKSVAIAIAAFAVSPNARAQMAPDSAVAPPPDREPPSWGVEGPYRLDILLAGGLGARVDDPPLYRPISRAVPAVETGLDLFLSERLSFGFHYSRFGLGDEESGVLPNGMVNISRTVDALWLGLRVDPLRSDVIAGYLRLGPGLVWQHLDLNGLAWEPMTPSVQTVLSCEAVAMGFGIRAALGVDVVVHEQFRFLAETGADNLRMTSDTIGTCGPGAGTATLVALRSGFVYGLPL